MIAPASGAAPAIWFPRAGKLQFTTYGLSGTTPLTQVDPDATAAGGGSGAIATSTGARATESAVAAIPAMAMDRALGLKTCMVSPNIDK
ncbi:hypothetical protein JCM12141A_54930 [Mycolicibacterium hodleri]